MLEEHCADTQIRLEQLISLLNMDGRAAFPIPPKHLQFRVAGVYNDAFFLSGKSMVGDIEEMLNHCGRTVTDFESILDFGCGCGRHLIPLGFLVDHAKITGTDIDEEAIHWFRANYPSFKSLVVNRIHPPTEFADGAFDFIYCVSVFTHLPEDMQNDWLAEISRILRPGGLALLTTHGEKHYSKLTGPALDELLSTGFHYSVGTVTAGLPEFYQTTYHTHAYIEREWDRYFEVVAIRALQIGKNQDAVLVRKRS